MAQNNTADAPPVQCTAAPQEPGRGDPRNGAYCRIRGALLRPRTGCSTRYIVRGGDVLYRDAAGKTVAKLEDDSTLFIVGTGETLDVRYMFSRVPGDLLESCREYAQTIAGDHFDDARGDAATMGGCSRYIMDADAADALFFEETVRYAGTFVHPGDKRGLDMYKGDLEACEAILTARRNARGEQP
ncbi:hypothetical protein CENSYa_0719 [Cenarchaeum symbiosum A]|uniref:Uncharacterized protein n=1 Tax=Cenarchaeum symbiosum (strain A) TaxID=414004 RepID=A0RVI5_CENSY|nr:hypothetical protein CENSYa_0719 [Cenarchaeum symbiosum A]